MLQGELNYDLPDHQKLARPRENFRQTLLSSAKMHKNSNLASAMTENKHRSIASSIKPELKLRSKWRVNTRIGMNLLKTMELEIEVGEVIG